MPSWGSSHIHLVGINMLSPPLRSHQPVSICKLPSSSHRRWPKIGLSPSDMHIELHFSENSADRALAYVKTRVCLNFGQSSLWKSYNNLTKILFITHTELLWSALMFGAAE